MGTEWQIIKSSLCSVKEHSLGFRVIIHKFWGKIVNIIIVFGGFFMSVSFVFSFYFLGSGSGKKMCNDMK